MDTMIIVAVLGGSMLVILGGLIGHSLSQHLLTGEIRRQARVRREVGEQWRALQAERARLRRFGAGRPVDEDALR